MWKTHKMSAKMVDSQQTLYKHRWASKISLCGQQRLSQGGTFVVVHFQDGMVCEGHCKEV